MPTRRAAPHRPNAVRASDAEREAAVARLREHYAAGRLSAEELSSRVEAAYASRTAQELQALTIDLPDAVGGSGSVEPPGRRRVVTPGGRALRASFRVHLWVYILTHVLLIGIWAAAGGGYFWPVWSILGWGMGVAGHGAPILAGLGTRPVRRRVAAPTSPAELASTVESERPDLRAAAAPDGTVTLLFSDIANSTELNLRLGDLRWLELLRTHNDIIRKQVAEHHGFEVKSQGDGFMVAFPSARSAVLCACAIQQAIGAELGEHPDGPIRVRVGLHTGEAIKEDSDFYGRNVIIAARLAAQAQPGEVLCSPVVKELTESAGDLDFGPARPIELKGLGVQTGHSVQPRSPAAVE